MSFQVSFYVRYNLVIEADLLWLHPYKGREHNHLYEYESISMIVSVSGEYLTLNYSYDDDHFEAAPRFLLLRATFDTI